MRLNQNFSSNKLGDDWLVDREFTIVSFVCRFFISFFFLVNTLIFRNFHKTCWSNKSSSLHVRACLVVDGYFENLQLFYNLKYDVKKWIFIILYIKFLLSKSYIDMQKMATGFFIKRLFLMSKLFVVEKNQWNRYTNIKCDAFRVKCCLSQTVKLNHYWGKIIKNKICKIIKFSS